MAIPFQLFYNISDADGETSRTTLDIDPTNMTLADIPGIAQNGWDIINPLITGHLESVGMTINVDTSGFTNAVASVLADVQEGAEFLWKSANGFIKTFTLPTFDEAKFTSSGAGSDVNTADAAVLAFEAQILAGLTPNAVDFFPVTTSHGEDLTTLTKGVQKFGASRSR